MTSGAALLADARRAGLALWIDGDRLRVRGAAPAPAELMAVLRAGRAELMAALTDEAAAAARAVPLDAEGFPNGVCRSCGGRSFWRRPVWLGGVHWCCHRCHPLTAGEIADACCIPPAGAGELR